MENKIKILENYIPKEAAPIIANWITKTQCVFTISKARNSKFGDYRPPFRDKGHRISVNHDLQPMAFLITTIHEFAHLKTWVEYGRRAKPHGVEWKNNYKALLEIFLKKNLFPEDLVPIIQNHLENPKASSCSDPTLYKALHAYQNPNSTTLHHLDDLAIDQKFKLSNGRTFIKKQKLRTRYKCLEVNKKQYYLIPGIAEVFPIED